MRAIEMARRLDVIEARERGIPSAEVARAAQVSERTVRRWVARWHAAGSITPLRSTGRRPRIPTTAADDIAALVQANPTATLATLCDTWTKHTGETVSTATMSRTLQRQGWVKRRIS